MALLNFKDWLLAQESSPLTRSRDAAALGLAPPRADYMSRSTPTPFVKKNNEEAFKGTHKKHKKKGLTHHKPKGLVSVGPTGAANKKKVVEQPDGRLDSFLKSVDNLEADWKELQGILDKKAKAKPKPPVSKPKPEDLKKPPVKPEPDEEDHLDKPEDKEGDEEQEQQPPMGRQQSQKPPFRRTKPRNDEE
jgi:hypothetical protein